MKVRDAAEHDIEALTRIYNEVIATSDAIWLDEAVTIEDRRRWLADQHEAGHATLVAVDGDGQVAGYGSYGDFRSKSGYWPTVEHTIHVHAAQRGRGVGSLLLEALADRARAAGKLVIVAGIDGGNAASIRFHERHGFTVVGTMPAIGRKFDRPVDLVLLQRHLHPPTTEDHDDR